MKKQEVVNVGYQLEVVLGSLEFAKDLCIDKQNQQALEYIEKAILNVGLINKTLLSSYFQRPIKIKGIIDFIKNNPQCNITELAKDSGITRQTIHYYLKKEGIMRQFSIEQRTENEVN